MVMECCYYAEEDSTMLVGISFCQMIFMDTACGALIFQWASQVGLIITMVVHGFILYNFHCFLKLD